MHILAPNALVDYALREAGDGEVGTGHTHEKGDREDRSPPVGTDEDDETWQRLHNVHAPFSVIVLL